MTVREQTHKELLESLNQVVTDAAALFATASPILSDGRNSAHGILAQLVFWHERYVEVLRALTAGEPPNLIDGTFEMLNAAARHRYARDSMVALAQRLAELQKELDSLLRALPDWSVNFPVKRDSGFCNVDERVRLIDETIRSRTIVFRRLHRPA